MSNERREAEDFRGDVIYDVWRSGGNPDLVDYDYVDDRRYDGCEADDVAAEELRRQRRTP